jgi:hypothetical protein
VVDPSYEDTTHVVILDYDKPICYLHEWTKAWHLSFATLAELVDAVLVVKKSLVEKVTKSTEIFLVMEGGVIHEIVDLPDNINVTVLDYDTEGVEKERLEISPIDGELCVITKWQTRYARLHHRSNAEGAEAGVEESGQGKANPGTILER